jgi:hypothetical protein
MINTIDYIGYNHYSKEGWSGNEMRDIPVDYFISSLYEFLCWCL